MGIIEKDERLCLNCNNPINGRRLGATYCSVKCGYTFRNNKNRLENKNQNQIVKIIRKNDSILHGFFSNNVFNISYPHLKQAGFNFDYHTKPINEEKGPVGAELFKYKIKKLNNNHFKIEKL